MKKIISLLIVLASLLTLTAIFCFAETYGTDGTVDISAVQETYSTSVTYDVSEHFKMSIPASLSLNESQKLAVSLSDAVLGPDRIISVSLESNRIEMKSISDENNYFNCNIASMTDPSDNSEYSFQNNDYLIASIKGQNRGDVRSCTRELNLSIPGTVPAGSYKGVINFKVSIN